MLVLARVLASAPYSSLPRACNALQISLSIPAFLTRTFTCGTPVLGKEPKKASEAHLLAVKTRKDFLPKAAPFKNERTINIEQLAKLYTHERKRFAVLGELEIDHVELVGTSVALLVDEGQPLTPTLKKLVAELTSPGRYRWIAHVANLEKLRDGKISTLPITRTPLLDKYTREQLLVELKRRLETPRGARVLAKSKELKEKIAKKVRERNAVAHSFPPPHVVNAYVWNKLAGKDKKVSEERVRELVELVEMYREQRVREQAAAAGMGEHKKQS